MLMLIKSRDTHLLLKSHFRLYLIKLISSELLLFNFRIYKGLHYWGLIGISYIIGMVLSRAIICRKEIIKDLFFIAAGCLRVSKQTNSLKKLLMNEKRKISETIIAVLRLLIKQSPDY